MQEQLVKDTRDNLRHIKIVDSAEPSQIREKLLELGWRQQRLVTGDFCWWSCQYDKITVTRKTTQDCLHSLNENFAKQLEEILESTQIAILLIENPWQWVKDTGQMLTARGLEKHVKKEVLNYIHRWQQRGFILERTVNWKDTIDRLNELYSFYQKPYSLSSKSKGYPDDRILALPSGVRGKSGMALLECFDTIQSIANSSQEELLVVDGIGKKRAELIYSHFRKKTSRDLTSPSHFTPNETTPSQPNTVQTKPIQTRPNQNHLNRRQSADSD